MTASTGYQQKLFTKPGHTPRVSGDIQDEISLTFDGWVVEGAYPRDSLTYDERLSALEALSGIGGSDFISTVSVVGSVATFVYTSGAVQTINFGGRGITGITIVNGRMIATYTDGTTQDIGPAGPAGPPGETVAGLATAPVGVEIRAYRDTVGTAFLGLGRKGYDVVANFGAKALKDTPGFDSSTAFQNWAAAIQTETDGVRATIPYGKFKLDMTSRLVVGGIPGVDIRGAGMNATQLLFTARDSGFDYGTLSNRSDAGGFGDLTILGSNITERPLRIRWATGGDFGKIRVLNAGLRAGATQAQKDAAAACIIEASQNNRFQLMALKNSQHHGLILDLGAGGNLFLETQVNDIAQGGDATAHHIWSRQSIPATDPSLPTVYDLPTNHRFMHGYLEGTSQAQTEMVRLDVSEAFRISMRMSASDHYPSPLTMIYVGSGVTETHVDCCAFQGNSVGSPTRVVTGVKAATGAGAVRVTSPASSNTLLTVDADSGVDVTIDGLPKLPNSGSFIGGTGVKRINNQWRIARTVFSNLPTPSLQYNGVVGVVTLADGLLSGSYICRQTTTGWEWRSLTDPTIDASSLEVADFATVTTDRAIASTTTMGRYGLGATPLTFTLPPAVEKKSLSLRFKSNLGSRSYVLAPATGETIFWAATGGVASTPGTTGTTKRDMYELICYDVGQWTVMSAIIGATIP